MPLATAKQHFKAYRHIGYTSYNHQFDKHGDGVLVEKFRILLPLKKPIGPSKWKQIRHNVEVFAPGVDMASVRLHQPFAVPIRRPGSPGEIWTREGKELDVSDWMPKIATATGYAKGDPTKVSEHRLKPDTVLRAKKGNVRVGDLNTPGLVTGIYCPFHADKSPGEHIRILESGRRFLSCKKCGTIWMEDRDDGPGFMELGRGT
jgi:hypothetical protein